jgi:hypothetical protein
MVQVDTEVQVRRRELGFRKLLGTVVARNERRGDRHRLQFGIQDVPEQEVQALVVANRHGDRGVPQVERRTR